MTTANKPLHISGTRTNDALIDQLRACKNQDEILKFEKWFNTNIESEKLHKRICELLKNRSISRGLASKWLLTLIEDRNNTISKLSIVFSLSSISVRRHFDPNALEMLLFFSSSQILL